MPHKTFGGSWAIKACFTLAAIFIPVAAWAMYVQHEPIWIQLAPWTAVIFLFKAWPRAIRLDDEGLKQRTLFGRLKRIRYSEIEDVSYLMTEETLIVCGAGVQIEHGRLHQHVDELARLLEERTGKSVAVGSWESEEQYEEYQKALRESVQNHPN
jgi:hypothetical protein